jgi:hypothetical protein
VSVPPTAEVQVPLTIRGQAINYELQQVPARGILLADEIRGGPSFIRAKAAEMQASGFPGEVKYVEIGGAKYAVDGNNRLNAAWHAGLETVPARQVTLPFRGYLNEDYVIQGHVDAMYGGR